MSETPMYFNFYKKLMNRQEPTRERERKTVVFYP